MKEVLKNRNSERGGAGVKLLLILVGIILVANAGYNYVPVAYQGASFKQEMDGAIVKGTAMPTSGKAPLDAVKTKLYLAARTNEIPPEATIEVKQIGQTIIGRVRYAKYVELLPFGLYKYTYNFDYTSAPKGFVVNNS
jgi:hypothetical protein